jgi:MFS family permease
MRNKLYHNNFLRKIIIFTLSVSIVSGFVYSVIPPFLRLIGFTGSLYGIYGMISVFASLIGTLTGGFIADYLGIKKLFYISMILIISGFILISTAEVENIFIGGGLSGLGSSFSWIAFVVLASKMFPDERLAESFSYIMGFSSIGSGVGLFMGWTPVVCSLLFSIELFSVYRYGILFSAFIMMIFIFSLNILFNDDILMKKNEIYAKKKSLDKSLLIIFIKLSLIQLIISFGAGLSIQNIDYYFVLKYKTSSGELGSILGLQNILMGLLMFLMPSLSRRFGGPLTAYVIISSPSIILILLMTFTNNLLIASAIYIVRTILMNVANPLYEAFQMRLIPRDLRGRASSVLGIVWQFPAGLGRYVGGHLLDIDLELPLRLTTILYTIGLSMLVLLFRDVDRKSI